MIYDYLYCLFYHDIVLLFIVNIVTNYLSFIDVSTFGVFGFAEMYKSYDLYNTSFIINHERIIST